MLYGPSLTRELSASVAHYNVNGYRRTIKIFSMLDSVPRIRPHVDKGKAENKGARSSLSPFCTSGPLR
jgi:hypothetical protein